MAVELFFAVASGLIGLFTAAANYSQTDDQLDREEKSLELQREQLKLQKDSYNETLRSNYYSYMQQLQGMESDYKQNQLSINQTKEDIASNKNYLDRWASEYDLSMQNSIDEAFSTYQGLASNFSAGLVTAGESGHKGGSSARVNEANALALKAVNGTTEGFSLTNNRLGATVQANALDMLADRHTALSAVSTGYQSIESYKEAMESLQNSINEMRATTDDIKKQLDEYDANKAKEEVKEEEVKEEEVTEEVDTKAPERDYSEPVKEEKTQAQSTAERDNEKGKALTEAIKNSDEYKTYLARKNNQAANEIGKSQTEYWKQKLAENTQKAQEEANKAQEAETKVTTGPSDYWKEQLAQKQEAEKTEKTETKTTAATTTTTNTKTSTKTDDDLAQTVAEIKANKNKNKKRTTK